MKKIGIIVSRWNEEITESLLRASLQTLKGYDISEQNIEVIRVPGCFEVPLAAQWMAQKNLYDALICLGAVIKGETSHHIYISEAVSRGIQDVSLRYSIPIGFGVITTDTLEQAKARAGEKMGGKGGNKGHEAAAAVMEMVSLYRKSVSQGQDPLEKV